MSKSNKTSVNLIGASGLFIILLALKVGGILNIPWWLVFLPLYLGFLILGILLGVLALALVAVVVFIGIVLVIKMLVAQRAIKKAEKFKYGKTIDIKPNKGV